MDLKLHSTILILEEKLLTENVRKSVTALDELLHPGFVEFVVSGKEYNKKDVLTQLPTLQFTPAYIENFEIRQLENDLIAARYILKTNTSGKESLSTRISIWKYSNNKWEMLFHQATGI